MWTSAGDFQEAPGLEAAGASIQGETLETPENTARALADDTLRQE